MYYVNCGPSVCNSRIQMKTGGCAFRESQSRFHSSQGNRQLVSPHCNLNPTQVLCFSLPSYCFSFAAREVMASRFLLVLLLSTYFSMFAYTAAPPVNVATDQPSEPVDAL